MKSQSVRNLFRIFQHIVDTYWVFLNLVSHSFSETRKLECWSTQNLCYLVHSQTKRRGIRTSPYNSTLEKCFQRLYKATAYNPFCGIIVTPFYILGDGVFPRCLSCDWDSPVSIQATISLFQRWRLQWIRDHRHPDSLYGRVPSTIWWAVVSLQLRS